MNDSISAFDSSVFKTLFTDDAMRKVFTSKSYLEYCIQTEVGLAQAEAENGVIPLEAANGIKQSCIVSEMDAVLLEKETHIVGYPILPLVKQLDRLCMSGEGKYLHWGATTQDIMDTASMLQMKAGLDILERQLIHLRQILRDLTSKYLSTPMAGRTHLQHALPVTFGYKTAVWLSAFDRLMVRLRQLKRDCLFVQFGGAAGTLASLGSGDAGKRVRASLAQVLGLQDPVISWHSSRGCVEEVIGFLGSLGGSLGKIALDIMLMSSNEMGEVQEPFVPHRGASSTMPQKRNPISAEIMLASSKLLRNHVSLALDAMVVDFERASGPWHLEWVSVPEAFCVASNSLAQAIFSLKDIQVYPYNMKRNLDSTQGLIVGEAVMMGLAPYLGRNEAHDVVYEACKTTIESGNDTTLLDQLTQVELVTSHVSREELQKLCDPLNYLGCCESMAKDVLLASSKLD